MPYETLQINDVAGVRTITLNRPDDLNSANEAMTKELQGEMKNIIKDKNVRCLVITGGGRAFCAGQDLKEATSGSKPMDFVDRLRRGYNPFITQLQNLKIPTIASINGVAAGAGWSIALACDLRIASKQAKFFSAFSKIGLVPDSGMTWTLPQLVGYSRALEIAWLGDPITADKALEWGLVNRVVEPDQLATATAELAATLAKGPTRGFALTKQAFRSAGCKDLEAQLDYEALLQGIAGRSRDYQEGVSAFLGKRPAEFTGE